MTTSEGEGARAIFAFQTLRTFMRERWPLEAPGEAGDAVDVIIAKLKQLPPGKGAIFHCEVRDCGKLAVHRIHLERATAALHLKYDNKPVGGEDYAPGIRESRCVCADHVWQARNDFVEQMYAVTIVNITE